MSYCVGATTTTITSLLTQITALRYIDLVVTENKYLILLSLRETLEEMLSGGEAPELWLWSPAVHFFYGRQCELVSTGLRARPSHLSLPTTISPRASKDDEEYDITLLEY